MSSKTTELCILLVEETYGEPAARIFKILMVYGKQQLSGISRRTGLTLSQTRHCLAVLIQQHIVVWSFDKFTFYEADWLAAYSLLRSGKFVVAAQQRVSTEAGAVLSRCIKSGNVKASVVEHAENRGIPDQGNVDGVNGSSAKPTDAQKDICTAIYDALENGIVAVSNSSHFRGPEKNKELAEKHVRATNQNWKDKIKNVEKAAFKQSIVDTLDAWKYGSKELKTSIRQRHLLHLESVLLRQFAIIEGTPDDEEILDDVGKILKSNPANGAAQNSFDERISLRANYQKYSVLARSQTLVQLAADKIGIPTSQVYGAVLQISDRGITHCREFQRDPETPLCEDDSKKMITTMTQILESVSNLKNLRKAVGQPHRITSAVGSPKSKHTNLHRTKRRRIVTDEDDEVDQTNTTENGRSPNADSDIEVDIVEQAQSKVNGNIESEDIGDARPNGKHKGKEKVQIAYDDATDGSSESEDDDSFAARSVDVGSHLRILVEHQLLRHHPPGTYGLKTEGWSVPFNTLSHQLRITEMNTTICAHFNMVVGAGAGTEALRIVNVLQKKGKLDEKSLSLLTLMDNKLIRSRLTALHSMGYVELQELPRDNSRAPSKTVYLWVFDEDRCARQMQQDYYQAMSRCLQRLRMEQERVSDVLAKSQRSDVREREQELMLSSELDRLQKWREVKEQLLGVIGRLDDGVLLLRDL